MPTVLVENGFRFFFYSNENEEPMHIHIEKGGAEGKVWIASDVQIAYMNGFTRTEERQIMEIISAEMVTLKKKWNEYFS
jgi:hypothetical protein